MTKSEKRARKFGQILLLLAVNMLIMLWGIKLYSIELNKHIVTDNTAKLEYQRTIKEYKGE